MATACRGAAPGGTRRARPGTAPRPPPMASAWAAGWGCAACPMVSFTPAARPPRPAVSGYAGRSTRTGRARAAAAGAPGPWPRRPARRPRRRSRPTTARPTRARPSTAASTVCRSSGCSAAPMPHRGDRLAQRHDDQRAMPLGEVRRGDLEPAADPHHQWGQHLDGQRRGPQQVGGQAAGQPGDQDQQRRAEVDRQHPDDVPVHPVIEPAVHAHHDQVTEAEEDAAGWPTCCRRTRSGWPARQPGTRPCRAAGAAAPGSGLGSACWSARRTRRTSTTARRTPAVPGRSRGQKSGRRPAVRTAGSG